MDHDTLSTLFVASGALLIFANAVKKKRRTRRWWRTELYKKRTGSELMTDLKFHHISGQYKNFTRMSVTDFEVLLQKIGPKISKKDTMLRTSISIQDRLAVTLRFLASGDSYTSLQYLFRISRQSIGRIIPEVCCAIVDELYNYVKLPKNPKSWLEVADIFENTWNLPHCVGAIDGKHVILQSPMNSATEYFNYKGQFSIVLFALVDGNYNFLFADVGCQGRISDGGVFKNTKLYKMITENTLGLPQKQALPGRQMEVPYFFAADSAFSLSVDIMKPYPGDHAKGSPQRTFNYRLCRGRRVVENAFGIISAVFRVFRKPMLLQPTNAQLIVLAAIYLHNFMRDHSPNLYTPHGFLDYEENGILIEGSWRNEGGMESMIPLLNIPRRPRSYVNAIRNEFAAYFVKEGAISWQDEYP